MTNIRLQALKVDPQNFQFGKLVRLIAHAAWLEKQADKDRRAGQEIGGDREACLNTIEVLRGRYEAELNRREEEYRGYR